eukprot:RCo006922
MGPHWDRNIFLGGGGLWGHWRRDSVKDCGLLRRALTVSDRHVTPLSAFPTLCLTRASFRRRATRTDHVSCHLCVKPLVWFTFLSTFPPFVVSFLEAWHSRKEVCTKMPLNAGVPLGDQVFKKDVKDEQEEAKKPCTVTCFEGVASEIPVTCNISSSSPSPYAGEGAAPSEGSKGSPSKPKKAPAAGTRPSIAAMFANAGPAKRANSSPLAGSCPTPSTGSAMVSPISPSVVAPAPTPAPAPPPEASQPAPTESSQPSPKPKPKPKPRASAAKRPRQAKLAAGAAAPQATTAAPRPPSDLPFDEESSSEEEDVPADERAMCRAFSPEPEPSPQKKPQQASPRPPVLAPLENASPTAKSTPPPAKRAKASVFPTGGSTRAEGGDPQSSEPPAKKAKPAAVTSHSITEFATSRACSGPKKSRKLVTRTVVSPDGEFIQEDHWTDDDELCPSPPTAAAPAEAPAPQLFKAKPSPGSRNGSLVGFFTRKAP